MKEFERLEDAQALAMAIVDTIPEPFLVLNQDLRVLAASRCFYEVFEIEPADTRGRLLYSVGDGAWDIPVLRGLLERIIPEKGELVGFEVEHDFPNVGIKILLLNARLVAFSRASPPTILLAFRDITARRAIELEKDALLKHTEDLLDQQKMLLAEMQHRVANSLQIIASILLIKARAVSSEETRVQLNDAHQRVISVAEVQRHLHSSEAIDQIDVRSYLTTLCESLANSMVSEAQPITIELAIDGGTMESKKAVSFGLIVTELLINAIKYAYPRRVENARILVSYRTAGDNWVFSVADNGVGKSAGKAESVGSGLGSAIVDSLAKQLHAQVLVVESAAGLTVQVERGPIATPRLAA